MFVVCVCVGMLTITDFIKILQKYYKHRGVSSLTKTAYALPSVCLSIFLMIPCCNWRMKNYRKFWFGVEVVNGKKLWMARVAGTAIMRLSGKGCRFSPVTSAIMRLSGNGCRFSPVTSAIMRLSGNGCRLSPVPLWDSVAMVAGSHQCHYETQWQWLQVFTNSRHECSVTSVFRLAGNATPALMAILSFTTGVK